MSTKTQEFPEVGEIVIGTISKIGDHGAYATLDEYNEIQGFLHISEIAPGWVRNVTKFVKKGEKKVLLVKKINKERSDIDLSLKQISKDQKKKKLQDVKRFEKEKGILKNIQEKAGLTESQIEKLEDKLLSKYNSVFDAVVDIATNKISVLDDLKLEKDVLPTIEEISSKIQIPSVEIRGILELSNNKSNGVDILRKIILDTMKKNKENNVNISYLGAPKYRITVNSSDFKTAEKTLKPVLEEIQKYSNKAGGIFKFEREGSKKTGEG